MDRGVTYSAPLRVRLALHITDENNKNEYAQSIEQDVYFGNIQPDWLFDQLEICKESILKTNRKGGRLIFAGNLDNKRASICASTFESLMPLSMTYSKVM